MGTYMCEGRCGEIAVAYRCVHLYMTAAPDAKTLAGAERVWCSIGRAEAESGSGSRYTASVDDGAARAFRLDCRRKELDSGLLHAIETYI